MYAVQDHVQPFAPSLWCSSFALCAGMVTRGAVIAHRYTYAPPRCRIWQYRRAFIPLSVSLWNDLANPVFDSVLLAGFKSKANAFLLAQLLTHFFLLLFSLYLLSFYGLVCVAGVFGLIG